MQTQKNFDCLTWYISTKKSQWRPNYELFASQIIIIAIVITINLTQIDKREMSNAEYEHNIDTSLCILKPNFHFLLLIKLSVFVWIFVKSSFILVVSVYNFCYSYSSNLSHVHVHISFAHNPTSNYTQMLQKCRWFGALNFWIWVVSRNYAHIRDEWTFVMTHNTYESYDTMIV